MVGAVSVEHSQAICWVVSWRSGTDSPRRTRVSAGYGLASCWKANRPNSSSTPPGKATLSPSGYGAHRGDDVSGEITELAHVDLRSPIPKLLVVAIPANGRRPVEGQQRRRPAA